MAQVLGTLGFSLLKMSFLRLLRRLSAKLDSDRDAGELQNPSIDLRRVLSLFCTKSLRHFVNVSRSRILAPREDDASGYDSRSS